jgi:hypothetical protein
MLSFYLEGRSGIFLLFSGGSGGNIFPIRFIEIIGFFSAKSFMLFALISRK